MMKRTFLAGSMAAGLMVNRAAIAAKPDGIQGPGLLTLSGMIGKSNRGPLDPALDQLMVRHGAKFDKAFVLDAAALARLASVTIKPTLEYDAKLHVLSGPLLSSVLDIAGVQVQGTTMLGLRAVDGYTVNIALADAKRYKMIVATHIDGQALSLGGLGPLWAVYDADSLADFKGKSLKERFALCPWALYYIDVKSS